MAAPVDYRPVAVADYEEVARVWRDSFRSNGIRLPQEPSHAMLFERLPHEIAGGWEISVAEASDRIAGFVAVNRPTAVLEQMFVAPDFLRRGIGAHLLDIAYRAMPDGFTLWTHAENHRACAFYEARGMRFVGAGVHPRDGYGIRTYALGPRPA